MEDNILIKLLIDEFGVGYNTSTQTIAVEMLEFVNNYLGAELYEQR